MRALEMASIFGIWGIQFYESKLETYYKIRLEAASYNLAIHNHSNHSNRHEPHFLHFSKDIDYLHNRRKFPTA